MEVLVKVVSKSDVQNVSVNDSTLQKVEVTLAWGDNQVIAAAFDKTALTIAAQQYDASTLYVADLTFSVSKTEKKFQNVRLNKLVVF